MAFDLSAVFPLELAAITPKTTWSTTVVQMGGGSEQRNTNWTDARRQFDATTAPNMTLANFRLIEKHFNGRRARARAFPVLDRSCFSATTEVFGTGDGSTTAFQLVIADGDSANAYTREIYLPIAATYSIFDNASPVTEGVGAGKFQLSLSTGIVTFGTAPVLGHSLTWTGQFYVPVRYMIDEMPDSRLFIWTTGTSGLVSGPSIGLIETRDSS